MHIVIRQNRRSNIGLTCTLFCCTVSLLAHAQNQDKTENITFTLTGDSIINRRITTFREPATQQMYDAIRDSDVRFTNFETLILDKLYPGAAESGGAYQSSPAWVSDEIKWAGFNLVSTANNHAFDFGVEGMRSTRRALDSSGVVSAGTGENLALARDPAYLDTTKGRIALIACTSTFTSGSLAGEQRPDLVGRPGVNPLRFTTVYLVDSSIFDVLKTVSKNLLNDDGDSTENMPHTQSLTRIGGVLFRRGDTFAVHSEPNQSDLKGLISSVRNAHRQANWVIVSSHTHENGIGGDQTPPEFLITAAHAAIDAGADIFVAHGPHVLRGIEIYKGKPIFYSLANFIFQNETMQYQPAESYDSLGLPKDATVADYFDARSAGDTIGFPIRKDYWESVIAKVSFNHSHELKTITLIPISLGYKEPRSERGSPRLASDEQSRLTIDLISKLSKSFGTEVEYRGGLGIISLPAKSR